MELVPIIYTVLIIVAVIAVIAITVSYISFKIKDKNGLVDNSARKHVSAAKEFEQHVVKTVQRITKPLFYPEMKTDQGKQLKENITHKKRNEQDKPFVSQNEKSSNRIEVIKSIGNNPNKPREDKKQPQQSELKKNPNEKTLEDNILDKYADEHQDNMFTLRISKKDDGRKL